MFPVSDTHDVEKLRMKALRKMYKAADPIKGFKPIGLPAKLPIVPVMEKSPYNGKDQCRPFEIRVCALPREEWPNYVVSKTTKDGVTKNCLQFCDCMYDPYDGVEDVELVYVPLFQIAVRDSRPTRDRKLDRHVDDIIMVSQPFVKITYVHSFRVQYVLHSVEKDVMRLDERLNTGNEYISPDDPVSHKLGRFFFGWTDVFRPMPSVALANSTNYFTRCTVSRHRKLKLNDPAPGKRCKSFWFDVQYTSLFMLNELYSRRIVFTPKDSDVTKVERIIRFYSEESMSNSFIDLRLFGVAVAKETASLVIGLHVGDMRTPIADF
jgi:hypothetical protein